MMITLSDGSTLDPLDEMDEQVIRYLDGWDKATLIEWCMEHGIEEHLADQMAAEEERRREP